MYPFSISIDEHVPLTMGAGRMFFQGGPIVGFPGVGQKYFCRKWPLVDFPGMGQICFSGGARSGKITFSPFDTKKTIFLQKI